MNVNIVVNTDKAVEYARQKLGSLEKRAPQAVRTALNNAAKEIKKSDEKTAKSTYTDSGDLNSLTMDKASVRNLEVILRDSGAAVSITHFKPRVGTRGVTATINKNNGSKVIVHKSGNKGFFPGQINGKRYGQRYRKKNVTAGYLRNGGATIVGRTKATRLPIEKINSLSSPSAHGSPDVWNRVEPEGEALLYKHLDKEIERILSL
ncbi:MAG: hypothetical protein ACI4EA_02560 [Candidatus Ornithomonoglobus sp.]